METLARRNYAYKTTAANQYTVIVHTCGNGQPGRTTACDCSNPKQQHCHCNHPKTTPTVAKRWVNAGNAHWYVVERGNTSYERKDIIVLTAAFAERHSRSEDANAYTISQFEEWADDYNGNVDRCADERILEVIHPSNSFIAPEKRKDAEARALYHFELRESEKAYKTNRNCRARRAPDDDENGESLQIAVEHSSGGRAMFSLTGLPKPFHVTRTMSDENGSFGVGVSVTTEGAQFEPELNAADDDVADDEDGQYMKREMAAYENKFDVPPQPERKRTKLDREADKILREAGYTDLVDVNEPESRRVRKLTQSELMRAVEGDNHIHTDDQISYEWEVKPQTGLPVASGARQ
jgi:hypothetical protein